MGPDFVIFAFVYEYNMNNTEPWLLRFVAKMFDRAKRAPAFHWS